MNEQTIEVYGSSSQYLKIGTTSDEQYLYLLQGQEITASGETTYKVGETAMRLDDLLKSYPNTVNILFISVPNQSVLKKIFKQFNKTFLRLESDDAGYYSGNVHLMKYYITQICGKMFMEDFLRNIAIDAPRNCANMEIVVDEPAGREYLDYDSDL